MFTALPRQRLVPSRPAGSCWSWGPVHVYLFGSRTRPEAKGGDIDLLIRFRDTPETPLTALTRRLRMAIFDRLDEQKIDIVWDAPGDTSAFVPLAREGAVAIWASESNN